MASVYNLHGRDCVWSGVDGNDPQDLRGVFGIHEHEFDLNGSPVNAEITGFSVSFRVSEMIAKDVVLQIGDKISLTSPFYEQTLFHVSEEPKAKGRGGNQRVVSLTPSADPTPRRPSDPLPVSSPPDGYNFNPED